MKTTALKRICVINNVEGKMEKTKIWHWSRYEISEVQIDEVKVLFFSHFFQMFDFMIYHYYAHKPSWEPVIQWTSIRYGKQYNMRDWG